MLTRWTPAGNLAGIEIERLNRMFDSVFGSQPLNGDLAPAVDIYEDARQDVVIKAELPGFRRDDIKVTFEDDILTIEGQRESPTRRATSIIGGSGGTGHFAGRSRCRIRLTLARPTRRIRMAC